MFLLLPSCYPPHPLYSSPSFKYFNYICVHLIMNMCIYIYLLCMYICIMYKCVQVPSEPKRSSDLLEQLQAVVSHKMWMPGIILQRPARAVRACFCCLRISHMHRICFNPICLLSPSPFTFPNTVILSHLISSSFFLLFLLLRFV